MFNKPQFQNRKLIFIVFLCRNSLHLQKCKGEFFLFDHSNFHRRVRRLRSLARIRRMVNLLNSVLLFPINFITFVYLKAWIRHAQRPRLQPPSLHLDSHQLWTLLQDDHVQVVYRGNRGKIHLPYQITFRRKKTKSCAKSILELLYPFVLLDNSVNRGKRLHSYSSINLISLLKSAFFVINSLK